MEKRAGFVEDIFITPQAGGPMFSQDLAFVQKDKGIIGDRYGEGVGAFSKSKREVIRHITLIASEAIDKANDELDEPYEWQETRRNIITGGVDLNELVNVDFAVGQVALRGVELCQPCKRPEKLSGKAGFENAFIDRGGLRAEVLSSGIIAVYDQIYRL